jgi:protein-arginine kinase
MFKKVTAVRDRLRVLEQKVNSHKALSTDEKVDLQQLITRCYGSLTSFNLLFRDEEDKFRGSGG